jgi:hypothetical protein
MTLWLGPESPHVRNLAGVSSDLNMFKVWNRSEVALSAGDYLKIGSGLTYSWKRALGGTAPLRTFSAPKSSLPLFRISNAEVVNGHLSPSVHRNRVTPPATKSGKKSC